MFTDCFGSKHEYYDKDLETLSNRAAKTWKILQRCKADGLTSELLVNSDKIKINKSYIRNVLGTSFDYELLISISYRVSDWSDCYILCKDEDAPMFKMMLLDDDVDVHIFEGVDRLIIQAEANPVEYDRPPDGPEKGIHRSIGGMEYPRLIYCGSFK